jgi:hypothetical protein
MAAPTKPATCWLRGDEVRISIKGRLSFVPRTEVRRYLFDPLLKE